MKRSLFTIMLFAVLIITVSCKKPQAKVCDGYQSKAVITGADYRMCACCGGYFIEIDGARYRFFNLPPILILI